MTFLASFAQQKQNGAPVVFVGPITPPPSSDVAGLRSALQTTQKSGFSSSFLKKCIGIPPTAGGIIVLVS